MKYKTVLIEEIHISRRVVFVPDDATDAQVREYAAHKGYEHSLNYKETVDDLEAWEVEDSSKEELACCSNLFPPSENDGLEEFNYFFGK